MKVLIADDNTNRSGKIVENLLLTTTLSREDIIHCHTASEARVHLRDEAIDLLLLDILLPNRVENSPSSDTSLALLAEISDTNNLIKPRKIVGLTAYSEALASASPAFWERTWIVLETSEIQDDWLTTIEKCVAYLRTDDRQQESVDFETDLLVFTALRDPEMQAVRNLSWNWEPSEPADDVSFATRGTISVNDKKFSVVSAFADRMGMVSTAVAVSNLFKIYKPRLCVMTGICAGVRGRTDIGDIVFADACWDYQSGKFSTDEQQSSIFEIEPHQIPAEAMISARIDQLNEDATWLNNAWRAWPIRPVNAPRLLRGPIASGSSVLADSRVVSDIVSQNRKVRAIEMELYGLYLAGFHAPQPKPKVFGIKAVCDFADSQKGDNWQAYAAYMSAKALEQFAVKFLADFVLRR